MSDIKEKAEEIERLVLLSQKGDQDSFAQIYDLFVDPIFRYVYYRVNKQDVEDVVENVFLKAWEHLNKYKSQKNKTFSSWIYRIAHNLVVDHYRTEKKRSYDELDEGFVDKNRQHNPISNVENVFDKKVLRKALSKLKKNYQDVIIYKFVNDFSNKEIAEIMDKKEGSLRILQFRALRALKVELENIGVDYSF